MGFWEKVALVADMAISKAAETSKVVGNNQERHGKMADLKKTFGEIGRQAQILPGGSSELLSLKSELTEIASNIMELQKQINELENRINPLRVRLGQVRKGIFDDSPQVLSLKQKINGLQDDLDKLRNQCYSLESDFEKKQIALGRQAFAEQAHYENLCNYYDSVQDLIDTINQLQQTNTQIKIQGKTERGELRTQLKDKVTETIKAREIENQKYDGNIGARIKKELSEMPVLSITGDVMSGAALMPEIKERIKKDPNNPVNWIHLGYAMSDAMEYRTNYRSFRLVVNTYGALMGMGIRQGLNCIDNTKPLTPEGCFWIACKLAKKKICLTKQPDAIDLVTTGIGYYEIAIRHSNDVEKRLALAAQYLNLALTVNQDQEFRGEIAYFLGKVHQGLGNVSLFLRNMNLSRHWGFLPACEELKKYFEGKQQQTVVNEIDNYISQNPNIVSECKVYYRPNGLERALTAFENVVEQQCRKAGKLSERVFDSIAKEFLD